MRPCLISILATLAIFMSPLGNDRVAGTRGWLVSTEHVILSTWILKSFSAEVTIWWYRTQISSWFFFPFREVYPYISSPSFLVTNFPIMFLPHPWPSNHRSRIGIQLHFWPFLFPNKMNNQMHTGRISLRYCPSGMSQRGAAVLQLSTSGWCLHIGQNLCICFLFPVNWL